MKIKKENYKIINLFSYCEKIGISKTDSKYLIDNLTFNKDLNKKTYKNAIKTINRLKKEPIQYVLGEANFYGHIYKVNKNTLIPRFETEELVENTIKLIKEHFDQNVEVLDMGTGSGCIGITLKKELPYLNVTLSDISKKALKITKQNANDVDVSIVRSNLLNTFIKQNKKFNVIISNPPYISKKERVDTLVKDNEPHIALYAKNEGLYYYEEILKQIKEVLEEKFIIAFEIGMNQKEDIIKIIKTYLDNVAILYKKDLQGRDRMIFVLNLTIK